jgi:hypothetical protein
VRFSEDTHLDEQIHSTPLWSTELEIVEVIP